MGNNLKLQPSGYTFWHRQSFPFRSEFYSKDWNFRFVAASIIEITSLRLRNGSFPFQQIEKRDVEDENIEKLYDVQASTCIFYKKFKFKSSKIHCSYVCRNESNKYYKLVVSTILVAPVSRRIHPQSMQKRPPQCNERNRVLLLIRFRRVSGKCRKSNEREF